MAHIAAGLVAGDMSIHKPELSAIRLDIGITQAYPPAPYRLYLRAGQGDARLDAIAYIIIMIDFTISSNGFDIHTNLILPYPRNIKSTTLPADNTRGLFNSKGLSQVSGEVYGAATLFSDIIGEQLQNYRIHHRRK